MPRSARAEGLRARVSRTTFRAGHGSRVAAVGSLVPARTPIPRPAPTIIAVRLARPGRMAKRVPVLSRLRVVREWRIPQKNLRTPAGRPAGRLVLALKWILGLDLGPDSEGAVRTAAWLSAKTQPPAGQRVIGVHVVPSVPRVDVRDDELDAVVAKAEDAARDSVRAGGAERALDRTDVIFGTAPHEQLATACRYHHAHGILIGRHGPTDEEAFVRLGRVARRLIRELPAAVMVVPPDYRPPQEAGPIVVATDLSDDSIAAARFGLRLAEELGTQLLLVHVLRGSEYALNHTQAVAPDSDAFASWAGENGLESARTVTQRGDVVNRMLSVGHRENASMLICGSRHLSPVQRIFQASTGTDLARFATRPVLIVPPEAILQA
jgi:nucleotide-binding universal stress UspA family protein